MTTVWHNKQMFILSHSDEVLKTEEEPLAFSFHGHDQTKNRRTVNGEPVPPQITQPRKQAPAASALLRNIQNIRICTGKKPIVSATNGNERISIKNSLPYMKCVIRLSCVVYWPIYRPFFNGLYCKRFSLSV